MIRKPETDPAKYEDGRSGTVLGNDETHPARELEFWRGFNLHHGIPNDRSRAAFHAFKVILDGFDASLSIQTYLLEQTVTVLDIACYVYVKRLSQAGYPLLALYPKVLGWFGLLNRNPHFPTEVGNPIPVNVVSGAMHLAQKITRTTLPQVAGL